MKKVLFRDGKLKFSVLEQKNGKQPIIEFLEKIKKKRPHQDYMRVIRYFDNWSKMGHPPSNDEQFKKEKDEIYAIKAHQIRIYCFWLKGNELVLTHGCIKKQDKADPNDLEKAKRMREEYLKEAENEKK